NAVAAKANPQNDSRPEYALVIHGGAGSIRREHMSTEYEKQVDAALHAALSAGEEVLKNGGTALDAVAQTIMVMENSPVFNAGKGAVFTHEGTNELDASIMDGKNRNAGAVGGVTVVKNPILAAKAVMENSPHVLLTGNGANRFAEEQGLEVVDPRYFYTESKWEYLQSVLKRNKKTGGLLPVHSDEKFGTVGCAALDKYGNLAAGTSTGGMTNKRWNRIGDSPIIGAGTYANNATCAVSCTGHGEYFIRYAVAYDISALMEYKGMSFSKAAEYVIQDKLKKAGGAGGVIGVDKFGNVAMPFNTKGMYRGYAKPGERKVLF
ncbi:MAG TPA: isoaspartyl peptidase/L-asparaginase, partial [Phaeodactylibacter sp.]|nr:isoaspartyl peptidase/L-asparaginase [Phaeodactylibacter sp.]